MRLSYVFAIPTAYPDTCWLKIEPSQTSGVCYCWIVGDDNLKHFLAAG